MFCEYLGVLLFGNLLTDLLVGLPAILKQWLITILLGAVNIEQTKLLDFHSLHALLGDSVSSISQQRTILTTLATKKVIEQVQRVNGRFLGASQETDFYYDPHTKHYTGQAPILKSWCPAINAIGKVQHMDFFHTANGRPILAFYEDNFDDMRERFLGQIKEFRRILDIPDEQVLTIIIDRGIYKVELFESLEETIQLITWEKGYKAGQWDEGKDCGAFVLTRFRNNNHDYRVYQFRYQEQTWPKNACMRQFIVQATNPKGRMIEVSILAHDQTRPAEEIIRLMFHRWLQENDFKYLIEHFGINELTSYETVTYKSLEQSVSDKSMKSAEYKGLEQEKKRLETLLGKLLLNKNKEKHHNNKRDSDILMLSERLEVLEKTMKTTTKEVSRLQTLIEQEKVRLAAEQKALMDSLKILARNLFYERLAPFKILYNNYRDDHVIFRNLTRCYGIASFGVDGLYVELMPRIDYQPKVRKIVETVLDEINATHPVLPDDSGRIVQLSLATKSKKLFAIGSRENNAFY